MLSITLLLILAAAFINIKLLNSFIMFSGVGAMIYLTLFVALLICSIAFFIMLFSTLISITDNIYNDDFY